MIITFYEHVNRSLRRRSPSGLSPHRGTWELLESAEALELRVVLLPSSSKRLSGAFRERLAEAPYCSSGRRSGGRRLQIQVENRCGKGQASKTDACHGSLHKNIYIYTIYIIYTNIYNLTSRKRLVWPVSGCLWDECAFHARVNSKRHLVALPTGSRRTSSSRTTGSATAHGSRTLPTATFRMISQGFIVQKGRFPSFFFIVFPSLFLFSKLDSKILGVEHLRLACGRLPGAEPL